MLYFSFLLSLMLFFLFFSLKMVSLNGITNEHYDITSKKMFLVDNLDVVKIKMLFCCFWCYKTERYCFIVVVKLSKKEARNIS